MENSWLLLMITRILPVLCVAMPLFAPARWMEPECRETYMKNGFCPVYNRWMRVIMILSIIGILSLSHDIFPDALPNLSIYTKLGVAGTGTIWWLGIHASMHHVRPRLNILETFGASVIGMNALLVMDHPGYQRIASDVIGVFPEGIFQLAGVVILTILPLMLYIMSVWSVYYLCEYIRHHIQTESSSKFFQPYEK